MTEEDIERRLIQLERRMDFVSSRLTMAMAAMQAVADLELKVTERLKMMDLVLEANRKKGQ